MHAATTLERGAGMPLVIPERTIDTLFTFELISAAPTAIVISPNNNRGPRTPDHEVRHASRKFVFECKTIYTAKSTPGSWVVRVPRPQLTDYLAHGQPTLVYVLPAEPSKVNQPWIRKCRTDPDHRGCCQACSNPSQGHGAVYFRRWAGRQPPISSASAEIRLQPWFNHWAWCVRADALDQYLSLNPTLIRNISGSPTAEVPANDLVLERIPGALRLCHFLLAVQQDHDVIHGVVRPGAEDRGVSDDDAVDAVARMSTQSVAQLEPLEDDRRLVVGY
jgi:hypothetical protein